MRPSLHGGDALSVAMPVAAITWYFSAPPISTRATAGLSCARPASELPGTALHSGVGPTTVPEVGLTVAVTSNVAMLLPPLPLATTAIVPVDPSERLMSASVGE